MVRRFVTAFRRKWDPNFKDTKGNDLPAPFKTFLCTPSRNPLPTTMLYGTHASYFRTNEAWSCSAGSHPSKEAPKRYTPILRLSSEDIQQGLLYFYQKATNEVDNFVSQDRISKHMYRQGGILYHRSRIHDGQRWSEATHRGLHELSAQGLNLYLPVVDRWSP